LLELTKRKYSKPPDVNRYAEKKNIKKEKRSHCQVKPEEKSLYKKNNAVKRKAIGKEDYSYFKKII